MHQPEEHAHLVDEERRLFPGGEVATPVQLAPVPYIDKSPLRPAAGRTGVLVRDRRTRWHVDPVSNVMSSSIRSRPSPSLRDCPAPVDVAEPSRAGAVPLVKVGDREPGSGDQLVDRTVQVAPTGQPALQGVDPVLPTLHRQLRRCLLYTSPSPRDRS